MDTDSIGFQILELLSPVLLSSKVEAAVYDLRRTAAAATSAATPRAPLPLQAAA
jgi:hypothetical protein